MLSAPIEISETRMSFAESSHLIMSEDHSMRHGLTRQLTKRLLVFLAALALFAVSFYVHNRQTFDEIYESRNMTESGSLRKFTHTKF
jgi:hypothetical protein